MYSLFVGRYKRYMRLDTLEELRAEVGRYFTASEQPIAERLCTFDPARKDADGLVVNHWQDFRTDWYCGD